MTQNKYFNKTRQKRFINVINNALNEPNVIVLQNKTEGYSIVGPTFRYNLRIEDLPKEIQGTLNVKINVKRLKG